MTKHLRRRDTIVLGVTGALLVGGITAASVFRAYQTVWFINELDVAVNVEVDGDRVSVEKGGRISRSLHEGVHEVRVLGAEGAVLEEGPIDVPGRFDLVAYNVLGAAPLYKVNITYSSSQGPDKGNTQFSFLGGGRLAAVENADYVFVEPPRSITVDSKSHNDVIKVGVDVAKGGWRTTTGYLEGQRDLMKAASLARGVARAEPKEEQAFGTARHLTALSEGVMGTLRFLRMEKARTPADADIHQSYISSMRQADRMEEARAEYQARYKANPDSPLNGVLFARVAPTRAEARGIYEDLLKRHPEDVHVRRSAASFMTGERAYEEALGLLTKMQSDPRYRYYIDEHAASLVGLGRVPEALALVSRYASDEATLDISLAIVYARLARLPGAGTGAAAPRTYVKQLATKLSSDMVEPWASSLLGDTVSATDLGKLRDDNLRRAIEIQVAATHDPRVAKEKCESASPAALDQLNPVVAALLAAEFARSGSPLLADRLLAAREDYSLPSSALLRYVLSGTEHPDLWRLDGEVRAALDFVRGRRLAEQGLAAGGLEEEVTRGDVLEGVVTSARKAWPRLGSGAAKPAAGLLGGATKAAAGPSPLVVLRREKLL